MKNAIFTPTDILIPANTPFEKWSVIACDQFSSEREYWEGVRAIVGDAPSAYNMIIPEAYLEEIDEEIRIQEIRATMEGYLSRGILREIKDSFIYVERTLPDGRIRRGIIGVVDLEEYDFSGKVAAIRASEGTVLDRLPPRVKVRKAVPLELPHIITFINDKNDTVIKPIAEKAETLSTLYDFELMESGGFITGKRVSGTDADNIMEAMSLHYKESGNLSDSSNAAGGSNATNVADILMIMGDGNHSLAAAKSFWDELKQCLSESERENHPARKALVEVCNIYDPAIDFEAIHRVLFNEDAPSCIKAFEEAMPSGTDYTLKWVSKEGSGEIGIKASCIGDMLKVVQDFIDEYTERSGGIIDYIHGADAVEKLTQSERSLGIILPAMDKSDIFKTVQRSGVFPRKSFSVGHARDKRYYLECRKIMSN